jgi:lysylphosphatidylglycerol synthetase-like protein (DUF2156 family)
MNRSYVIRASVSLALLAATATLPLAALADEGAAMRHYRVTVQNLTRGNLFRRQSRRRTVLASTCSRSDTWRQTSSLRLPRMGIRRRWLRC